MELLLNLEKYDDKINSDGLSEKDKEEIKKSLEFEGEIEVSDVNIGPGADLYVISACILLAANIFMLGDKIDKGIEGWIKIGQRLKKLFTRKELISIDNEGASLLAVEHIASFENIKQLEKINETEINLVQLNKSFTDGRQPSDLISKPHNYYIQTYLINNEKHFVIGIKSNGEVNTIKCFGYNPYGISEIRTEQLPKK